MASPKPAGLFLHVSREQGLKSQENTVGETDVLGKRNSNRNDSNRQADGPASAEEAESE